MAGARGMSSLLRKPSLSQGQSSAHECTLGGRAPEVCHLPYRHREAAAGVCTMDIHTSTHKHNKKTRHNKHATKHKHDSDWLLIC